MECMSEYAKQEAIEFFKWNLRTIGQYLGDIKMYSDLPDGKLKEIEERIDGLQNNIGSKLESMKKSGEDTAEQLKKGFDSVPKTNPETKGEVTIIGSNNNIGGGDTIQNGDPMNVRHDILARSQKLNTAAV